MGVLASFRAALTASRDAGIAFDAAWRAALPQRDDEGWREALTATREAWRAAYEREPAHELELAIAEVAEDRLIAA